MTIWLTARTAGLVALVLLTAATCLGALGTGTARAGEHYVLQSAHRTVAALGLGALVVHVGTILADSFAHVGVTGAIVPFTSGYRASWVGLGSIAAYLLLLVAAVGAARGRLASSALGARVWRGVHVSAYAAWLLALLHGFATGTDSGQAWVRLTFLACLAAVPTCLVLRLSSPALSPHVPRNAAGQQAGRGQSVAGGRA